MAAAIAALSVRESFWRIRAPRPGMPAGTRAKASTSSATSSAERAGARSNGGFVDGGFGGARGRSLQLQSRFTHFKLQH